MDAIHVCGEDGVEYDVPLIVALTSDGQPAELVGNLTPEQCDHKGAMCSSQFALRCPRCGVRLFLSTRYLANLPENTVEEMYSLWCRAGWPEMLCGQWLTVPAYWVLLNHPLFAAAGGLPVRHDRVDSFAAEFAEYGIAEPAESESE